MANLNDPGVCRQQIKISPGSTKWIWFDWPKRELGTSTITTATWTLPSWATNEDQDIETIAEHMHDFDPLAKALTESRPSTPPKANASMLVRFCAR
jgi:hypothetical protein